MTRLTDLPAATSFASDDVTLLNQGGSDYQLPMSVLLAGTLTAANNLSDLPSAATALNNIMPASPAQGAVVYFNGTNWVNLPPGTSGKFLQTLGTGANPAWSNVAGALPGGAAQGDVVYYNGTDWVLLPASTSGYFLQTKGAGFNPQYSQALLPANNLSDISSRTTSFNNLAPSASVQGNILYYNGTNWVVLAPGTSGQYLQTQGAAANPQWSSSNSLPTSPSQGDIVYYNGASWAKLAAGTSGQVLKTQGAAANPIWSTFDGLPATPAKGDIVYYNGTAWAKLTPGTSGQYLQTQGAAADPIWASVSGSLPGGAVQGNLVYYNGSAWVNLTPGTLGQVLQTQGAAADPAWAAVLLPANNLSDLVSASTARTNLGLGTAATQASTVFAQVANNLSDLASASTARTNLGLGTAATQAATAFCQTANNLSDVTAATARTNLGLGSAALNAESDFLQASNDLSDLSSASTARSNLGLGSSATHPTSDFLQVSNNLSDIGSRTTGFNNLAPASPAQGNILYFNGTNWVVLATSATAGQVLTNNGTGTNPSWTTVSGGSTTLSVAEVDFGTTEVESAVFTITDAGVSGTSKILVGVAGVSPSDSRDVEEIFSECYSMMAVPGSGQFDLYMTPKEGTTTGKLKVWYAVG